MVMMWCDNIVFLQVSGLGRYRHEKIENPAGLAPGHIYMYRKKEEEEEREEQTNIQTNMYYEMFFLGVRIMKYKHIGIFIY